MQESQEKKAALQQNGVVSPQPRAAVSPARPALQDVFSGLMNKGLGLFKDEKNQLNVKAVNAVLFTFAVLLTLYYLNVISFSLKKVNNINLASLAANIGSTLPGGQEISGLKPLSFYQEGLKKRDIFKMGQRPASESTGIISSKAVEASSNLKLVGISWSEMPDAMIEDTKAGKTYFVKKGALIGDFSVEGIYKDKVVLKYQAETIELR